MKFPTSWLIQWNIKLSSILFPHSPHPQNDETLNWVDFTKEGLKFLIKAML